jgi:hypothetical protein
MDGIESDLKNSFFHLNIEWSNLCHIALADGTLVVPVLESSLAT